MVFEIYVNKYFKNTCEIFNNFGVGKAVESIVIQNSKII